MNNVKETYIELQTSEAAKKAGLKRIKRKHFVEKDSIKLTNSKLPQKKFG
jgi:hypothetical protein